MINRIRNSIRKRRQYSPYNAGKFCDWLQRNKGWAKHINLAMNIAYKFATPSKNEITAPIVKSIDRSEKKQVNNKNIYLAQEYKKNFSLPIFDHDHVDVSIIVPVFNQIEMTTRCIWSILKSTKNVSYEVLIADDCSTDTTRDITKNIKNVRHIKTQKNVGFLLNCNNAAKHARGKYLLFLNNDTVVQNNWLSPLVETLESDNSIGLVGSKLIYPDGTLQEAGGIIFRNGQGWNYGRNDSPEKIMYSYLRDVDYISGASIILRRDLWEKIGGFDTRFVPAYCEDSDLAFQIRYNYGLRVVFQPKSVVVHFEGRSNGTDTTSGQKKYQVINGKKFLQKWYDKLNKYHAIDENQIFLAKDHAYKKKTILIIDWKVLSFSKDTGSRATYQYMKFFQKCGFNVKLWAHDFFIEDDFLEKHLEDGFEVLSGCINGTFESWVKENGRFVDYVYLNRPNIAPFYIDLLRRYTSATIIYQGHDLHYLRQYRQRVASGNASEAESLLDTEKNNELNLCSKMDVACFVSEDEVSIIKKSREELNVRSIPLSFYDITKKESIRYIANQRKDICFVAGFRHSPNIDGVLWFVNEIYPKIKSKIPNIKFYVVGSDPSPEVKALAKDPSIIVTGFVSEERLDEIYSSVRLVVVPLQSGAGVKGKVIEAIYNKVPVITTSIGIEGINNNDALVIVQDDPNLFADEVVQKYNDFEYLDSVSSKSLKYIDDNFSFNKVKRVLSEFIPELLGK